MIDATGTIIALDGEYARVRIDDSGCGRCHEPGGCGGTSTSRLFCSTPRSFRVLNRGPATVGDRVTVVIGDGAVRRSATIAYGAPLLALLAGALSGSLLAGEIGAMAGAGGGVLLAWLAVHASQRRQSEKAQGEPYIRY